MHIHEGLHAWFPFAQEYLLIGLLSVGLAYYLAIWPAGRVVSRALRRFTSEQEGLTGGGLVDGGLWIGRLERVLVLTFLLMGTFSVIGYVIVAKSILRFREVSSSQPGGRKLAEYVIIGTMLSIVLALAAAAIAVIAGLVTSAACSRYTYHVSVS